MVSSISNTNNSIYYRQRSDYKYCYLTQIIIANTTGLFAKLNGSKYRYLSLTN